jgi:ribonuclease Z
MQISVPLFSSPPNPKIPSLFPSQHLPSIFHGKGKPTTLTTRNFHFLPLKIKNKPFIVKASSFLSEIGRAIEEEEDYRKARAAVIRKGIDLGGYAIEGLSIGGQETCIIIPEFKCAFDIGRCPTRAIHQNFVFITHAHLDHIVGFFSTTHVFGIPCEERKKNMFSSFPNWLRLTLLFSKTCGLCLVFVRIEYGCSVIW